MLEYIKKRWENYSKKKSLFSKLSDLLFIVLVIAMLIPASRKEISAFVARLMASSPNTIQAENQKIVPENAYSWNFQSLNGTQVSLADFKDEVILLNFWATWCPPCIAEMPDLQKLYDQFGQKAVFLLITDEDPEVVSAFMQKRGFKMPIYINHSPVPEIFATRSIPTTYLIDSNGKVVIRVTGAAKWNSESTQQIMNDLIANSH